MHDILCAIGNQKTVQAAVLDFTKEFDRVPHGLLLHKLSQIANVNNYLLRWVHNFLTDRKQRVVLQGCSSDPKPVCSGVPQGSVFWPVLFLVFINDLPECLNCSCALFADDTLVYQKISSSEDCKRFQHNLDSLSTWADKWGMSFNISKGKIISFNPKTDNPQYKLIGSVLDHVDSTKYLGVTLQPDCKFDQHILKKVLVAKRQLGMIKRALYWTPEESKAYCLQSPVSHT